MIDAVSDPAMKAVAMPLVTIVIPVLNEAGFIAKCLESVRLQDYPCDRTEVLIAEGGSTDGTRQIIEQFVADLPNWRVLDNPGRTQAKAFNLGLRHASGEIFVRMDAHALYPPDYVRRCVETLQQTGAANVGGVWKIVPGGPGLIAASIAIINQLRFGTGWSRHRVGGAEGPTDSVIFGAFSKKLLDIVGPMNEQLLRTEDNELNSRLRRAGMTCYFKPDIVVTYFARPSLRGHLRQMYGNGKSVVSSFWVDSRSVSLRHMLPIAFVFTFVCLALAGLVWEPAWDGNAAMVALYLTATVAATTYVCWNHGWRYVVVLPWLLLLTHVSYAIGSLVGTFRAVLGAERS